MRGTTVCDTWARIPGLSNYWCLQIQWRIDENATKALTEPRFCVPDESIDTVILVQTIFLLQLFFNLQEFDPCLKDDPDEELLRIFQDSIAENFNPAPPATGLDGETLERIVRGLMMAHREGQREEQAEVVNNSLQRLLLQLLAELNRPLYQNGRSRYEEAYGPRTKETWAARYATRIMQWRIHTRTIQPALREEIITVGDDVCPLDVEGVEVYRLLRISAPGDIHVATPLQPDLRPDYNLIQLQPQHAEAGLKVQHILGSPLVQTPSRTTVSSATPQTPLLQQQQYPQQGNNAPPFDNNLPNNNNVLKRDSLQVITLPPMKRQRQVQDLGSEEHGESGTGSLPKDEEPVKAVLPTRTIDATDPVPPVTVASESQHAALGDSTVLQRILDKVTGVHRQIENMHLDLGRKFEDLEQRLGRIEEWITDPE